MKEKIKIEDLFARKLQNHQVPVRPDLWSGISSKITDVNNLAQSSGGTTTLKTGKLLFQSIWMKSAIIVGGIGVFGAAIYLSWNNEPTHNEKQDVSSASNIQNIDPDTEIKSNSNKEIVSSEELNTLETDTKGNTALEAPNTVIRSSQSIAFEEKITTEDKRVIIFNEESSLVIEENNEKKEIVTRNGEDEKESVFLNEDKIVEEIEGGRLQEDKKDQKELLKNGEIGVLPNVFSPNGDGQNDELFIESKNLEDFTVVVLNEKGTIVYQGADPAFRWDGRDTYGNLVEEGKYLYYIVAKDKAGDTLSRSSTLLITH